MSTSVQPPTPLRARSARLAPLGRRFWALWTASTLSGVGNGLSAVALPLLAERLDARPLAVAGVLFAQRLPWLVVAIPAGAYADRADIPRLMRRMDLIRALLVAGTAALVAAGDMTIVAVYVLALAVGTCDTFFAGSTQALIPAMVVESRLERANGVLAVGSTAGEEMVGPALAGVLFSLWRFVPFVGDAASFVASAALLRGLGRPAPRVRTGIAATLRTLRADTRLGLDWYRTSAVLRLATATVAVLAFSQALTSAILVLFVTRVLGLDPVGYGVVMAVVALGAVGGGAVAAGVLRRFATATVVVAVAALAGAGYLGVGATSSPYLAGTFLCLEAVAVTVGNVATISFRQRITPPEMRARVANVWRSVVGGVVPVGALAGGGLGVVGALGGLRCPFYVAGGLQLALAAVVARPLRRAMGAVER